MLFAMYQAFCDQKGKVPYIPMSHPYENNQKHSMYRSVGTSVGETRLRQQDAFKWHGAAFVS